MYAWPDMLKSNAKITQWLFDIRSCQTRGLGVLRFGNIDSVQRVHDIIIMDQYIHSKTTLQAKDQQMNPISISTTERFCRRSLGLVFMIHM